MYARAADLLEAELGEELVALEPKRGECFGFNEVATCVWRMLDQPRSFESLTQGLLAQYEVDPGECERDLTALLAKLREMDLIRYDPENSRI